MADGLSDHDKLRAAMTANSAVVSMIVRMAFDEQADESEAVRAFRARLSGLVAQIPLVTTNPEFRKAIAHHAQEIVSNAMILKKATLQ